MIRTNWVDGAKGWPTVAEKTIKMIHSKNPQTRDMNTLNY